MLYYFGLKLAIQEGVETLSVTLPYNKAVKAKDRCQPVLWARLDYRYCKIKYVAAAWVSSHRKLIFNLFLTNSSD